MTSYCILQVPPCRKCGGILKPDVVFFGDNVASDLVDYIYSLVDDCDTVLVLGSSLFVSQTFSHTHTTVHCSHIYVKKLSTAPM